MVKFNKNHSYSGGGGDGGPERPGQVPGELGDEEPARQPE